LDIQNQVKVSESEVKEETNKAVYKEASGVAQLSAWLIDVAMVVSFVALTAALLVAVSGIDYKIFAKIVSNYDLIIFSSSLFTIYYLMYFTILDLSNSPGKTFLELN